MLVVMDVYHRYWVRRHVRSRHAPRDLLNSLLLVFILIVSRPVVLAIGLFWLLFQRPRSIVEGPLNAKKGLCANELSSEQGSLPTAEG